MSEAQTPNTAADNSFLDAIAIPEGPAPSSKGQGGGTVMITNPQDGSTVSRSTYIKALAKAGWNRRQIMDHLKEHGHDVRYQTVYQATLEFFPKRTDPNYNPEVEGDPGEAFDENNEE